MLRLHSLLAGAALASTLFAQRQLLLPDNHHLSKSQEKTQSPGSWWGTTIANGRRFQVLYEASHFTNPAVGVSNSILINELAFRGEDAEHNVGGQTYATVTVDVYKTALTTATMNTTTFLPNVTGSVLISSTSLATVTVLPSTGSCPNDYCIVLPLAATAVAFDPTGGAGPEVNLLVDLRWTGLAPSPTFSTPMIGIEDTTPDVAAVRGRGIFAATPTALTGTASTAPPVIRVGFAGSGGAPSLIPARVESYGAACGGAPSAFYQLFRHTENFDLAGTSLTLTPDVPPPAAPNFYIVAGGTTGVDPLGIAGAPVSTADDGTVPFALSGTLLFPGGSTNTVRPSTNGYVILDPTSTETGGDFSATLAEFLGSTTPNNYSRLAPCWHDFHAGRNLTTNPGSGLYARAVGGVDLITWNQVGSFDTTPGGNEVHTFQCAINTSTGVVEFRYGAMQTIGGDTLADVVTGGDIVSCLVGFSRGTIGTAASVDPQSRDLSIEVPFTTSIEGSASNMGLTAANTPAAVPPHYAGRMFPGQTVRWNVNNIPATSLGLIGVILLDAAASRPGLQLPGVTAPDCMLSTTTGATVWEVFIASGSTHTGANGFLVPPGFSGVDLHAQAVILFGGPNIIAVASNALKHTVGLQ